MQCPKCQFENREGIKFCEECGAKFESECPACNANIPQGRKFCGECGYALSGSTETASLKFLNHHPKRPYQLRLQLKVNESTLQSFSPTLPDIRLCLKSWTRKKSKRSQAESLAKFPKSWPIMMDSSKSMPEMR